MTSYLRRRQTENDVVLSPTFKLEAENFEIKNDVKNQYPSAKWSNCTDVVSCVNRCMKRRRFKLYHKIQNNVVWYVRKRIRQVINS